MAKIGNTIFIAYLDLENNSTLGEEGTTYFWGKLNFETQKTVEVQYRSPEVKMQGLSEPLSKNDCRVFISESKYIRVN